MIKNTMQIRRELDGYSNKDTKIARMVKNGELIRLNRGIFETDRSAPQIALGPVIYGPSYVSFETALAYYGLIPEYVPNCTCATFKKNKKKVITNNFGNFIYKDVPAEVFPYGITYCKEGDYTWAIATPEKAICDMLNDHAPIQKDIRGFLFDGMRIDEDEFEALDKGTMLALASLYKARNLRLLEDMLRE